MSRFEPIRLLTRDRYWQFYNSDDVEFIAHGSSDRYELLWKAIDDLASIQTSAVKLLESFMKDSGEFELTTVEVLEDKSDDGLDLWLRFCFVADRDPHKYGDRKSVV